MSISYHSSRLIYLFSNPFHPLFVTKYLNSFQTSMANLPKVSLKSTVR